MNNDYKMPFKNGQHTVEKIGGTSMSQFKDVLNNIFLREREKEKIYNRIFVLSAYSGITDMLLEHKKTGKPGVFALYSGAESEWAWSDALSRVSRKMRSINASIFTDTFIRHKADQFVTERIEGVRSCLIDLHRLCSFGHFQLAEHLMTVREMLSAVGEAHSAHNTTLLLQQQNVEARFVDLTGWRDTNHISLEERIKNAFENIDLRHELPIVTGYAHCNEGLMRSYDRGYSEITLSNIAVLTGAREAIIHKEYHLSSADPQIVNPQNVLPIGRTNYDVADQLSNLGMEAIHPKAAKGLRQCEIPLRIKNTFEPEHAGTLIDSSYKSENPCVEIIAGRKGVFAIEFFEQDIVGIISYERHLLDIIERFKAKVISKDINANTITHYIAAPLKTVKRINKAFSDTYPSALISIQKIAIVSVIGSHLQMPETLKDTINTLHNVNVNIMALHHNMRHVDIQIIAKEDDYENIITSLHRSLIRNQVQKPSLHKIA